jgi:thiosulfate reductase cytochrome b subunit
MKKTKMFNIYLYSRYERFWHWLQSAIVVILLVTGFEVHGTYSLLGFLFSVEIHNFVGLSWLILFAFFVFWLFTTGEYKQYIPTTRKMLAVMRYYAYGIFRGESHPVPKRREAKHNPLQRLVYLSLAALLLPIQMVTGFLYWSYNSWQAWGLSWLSLQVIAYIHMAGAFAILSFIVVHLYMITTGHTIFSHTRAMITGWEEVTEGTQIEEWEQKDRKAPQSLSETV